MDFKLAEPDRTEVDVGKHKRSITIGHRPRFGEQVHSWRDTVMQL